MLQGRRHGEEAGLAGTVSQHQYVLHEKQCLEQGGGLVPWLQLWGLQREEGRGRRGTWDTEAWSPFLCACFSASSTAQIAWDALPVQGACGDDGWMDRASRREEMGGLDATCKLCTQAAHHAHVHKHHTQYTYTHAPRNHHPPAHTSHTRTHARSGGKA